MTPIKYITTYIFRGDLLRLKIRWNKTSALTLSVGYNINREKWDGRRCLKNTTHGKQSVPAAKINIKLSNLEKSIEEAFFYFEKLDIIPTTQQLKTRLHGGASTPESNFFTAFDRYLSDGRTIHLWSENTHRRIKAVKTLLYQFDPNLKFSEWTATKAEEFIAYLTEQKDKKEPEKSKYLNSTILKNWKILRGFLKWATEKDLNFQMDYLSYKPTLKQIKKTIIFLTWSELMEVYNYDYPVGSIKDQVRDAFCLSCFTSLRYSDLAQLQRKNITEDSIKIITQKTTDALSIDLNKYSKSILDKYKDYQGDTALPILSMQRMNDRLKEIGRDCGLDTLVTVIHLSGKRRIELTEPKWKFLSSHCGRRTFICNALSLGIPPNVVMKWTGHKDYEAMRPYIDISDEIKKKSMQYFDNL